MEKTKLKEESKPTCVTVTLFFSPCIWGPQWNRFICQVFYLPGYSCVQCKCQWSCLLITGDEARSVTQTVRVEYGC